MSEKRRGLGRGLGALIPPAPAARSAGERPVDVFFAERDGDAVDSAAAATAPATTSTATATPTAAALAAPTARNVESQPSDSPGEVPGQPGGATLPTQSEPTHDVTGEYLPASDQATDGAHRSPSDQAAEPSAQAPSGTDLLPVPGAWFAELLVSSISPNPRQPRQAFDEEALAELSYSIREVGVLQPIVVRAIPLAAGAAGEEDQRFELIMGERRLRATQLAGLERIPAIVRDTMDDALLRDALLENLHRSELNPLEEAAAYQQLLDDFGCTHEELATRIGRSRPQISNTIRLLRLPPAVQRRVAAGVLSAGHARALLGLDDVEAMDKLAQRIVNEGMSVRATEEAVAVSDGDSAAPTPRRRPRAGGHHAELDDLAGRLADRLDTRVSISLGRSKGKISVEFASVEDLNRILAILAPQERKAFQEQP